MSENEQNQENNEVPEQQQEQQQEVPQDRPEENYKAELERKNREIERLRLLAVERQEQPKQRDPNNMRTWSDHELKAVIYTNDPNWLHAKDEANEIMLDRKVDARLARQAETHRRVSADLELKQKFPEAADPSSELSSKIEEVISKYDLDKSPAGRLVAAKLAASELNQGKNSSDAIARQKEADRIARVKGQMVDGDRAKPTTSDTKNLDEKRKTLADKLMSSKENQQVDAISEILKDRGMSQKEFFKK